VKNFFAIVLILVTVFLLYALSVLIPQSYYDLGKAAYDKQDYVGAYNCLKTAIMFKPKNQDIRYYYVKSLTNLKPTLEVQKALYEISKENLPDSADLVADRQISKWKNRILFSVGDNYIEQVPFDNKILRWDAAKFPLKVSVENTSTATLPDYYSKDFVRAFEQWQAVTGFIKFKFVQNPQDADIVVKIISSDEMNKCQGEDCKYAVAYTTPVVKGTSLKQMKIAVYDLDDRGNPFTQKVIYNTILHEIGHSLGIMGHSYNKDDLMYMSGNSQEGGFGKNASDLQMISSDDVNTISLLYKLIPDITNTDLSEFDTGHQFFAPIIMGSEDQISSRKVLEAQNYINSAPNIPNGYIDLAAALTEQKEYNEAIEALNKALALSYNNSEKFMAYYNLAVVYFKIKDFDNAMKYAQLAKEADPSADVDGLIAEINYFKGNSSFAKEGYIASLEKNPGNEVDAINLAVLYAREFNFVQAGKTLNNLVKANPTAANNPRVKAFGLWMFLFK